MVVVGKLVALYRLAVDLDNKIIILFYFGQSLNPRPYLFYALIKSLDTSIFIPIVF